MSFTSNVGRSRGLGLFLTLAAGTWLAGGSARAEMLTAVRSGSWNDPQTWSNGKTPVDKRDSVTIPAGRTVTIPARAKIYLMANGDAGQLLLHGTLVVAGDVLVHKFVAEPGSSSTIEPGGVFTASLLYKHSGTMLNRGMLKVGAYLWYQYGSLINEAGGTLEIRTTCNIDSTQRSLNRGTIQAFGALNLYAPFDNAGVISVGGAGDLLVARPMNNLATGSLQNAGHTLVHGAATLSNDGAIVNTGKFENTGRLVASCTGKFEGAAPTQTMSSSCTTAPAPGSAPPVATPAAPAAQGSWQSISGTHRLSAISVGSSTVLAGTSTGGKLLRWAGSAFVYATQSDGATQLAMAQTSIAADGTWWGVKSDGSIWRNSSAGWTKVDGELRTIAVGSANHIWGVNAANDIFKWEGSGWTRVPGDARELSVGSDGTVWAIKQSGKIVRWNGASWAELPGEAAQVSVGNANKVWVVNAGGSAYQWNGAGWDAVPEAGSCRAVAVAADGTVLAMRSDGTVYRKP